MAKSSKPALAVATAEKWTASEQVLAAAAANELAVAMASEDSCFDGDGWQPVAKSSKPALTTAMAPTAEKWTASEQAVVASAAANDLAVAMVAL